MRGFAIFVLLTAARGTIAHPGPEFEFHAETATWEANQIQFSYGEFSTHPLARRTAIYQNLDRDGRANLWLGHFAEYRNSHPDLTPEQGELIGNAITWLNSDQAGPTNGMYADAIKLFGKSEATALFGTLGGLYIQGGTAEASRDVLGRRSDPVCSCYTRNDFCDGDTQCRSGSCAQNSSLSNCGWLAMRSCDGLCYLPANSTSAVSTTTSSSTGTDAGSTTTSSFTGMVAAVDKTTSTVFYFPTTSSSASTISCTSAPLSPP